MAIVTDPDILDRNQVIYNTPEQKFNMYQVGSLISGVSLAADGEITAAGTTFTDTTNSQFASVTAGDILCVYGGAHPGHYLIASATATVITLDTGSSDLPFTSWTNSDTGILYDVRAATGGTIADGVSEQAAYSFSKEEWKADSALVANGDAFTPLATDYANDLIRHPFMYEPITPTQFEIGGLAAHDNWDYANLHTKNLVRSGGWRNVDTAGVNQEEYVSMISLGAMDADAQPYYQHTNETQAKVDFAFTGTVNEAVWLYDNAVFDRRDYFKAFLRKKGKTYASYDLLTEQNISALTYKDYSFPLSHSADAAITSDDGEIVGVFPYKGTSGRTTTARATPGSVAAVDAVDTDGVYTFEKTGETWATDGVRVGDAVLVTTGNNLNKYFQITAVSETSVTVANADGIVTGSGTETISFYTNYITELVTGATVSDQTGDVGRLTKAGETFVTDGVTTNDLVVITSSATTPAYIGVYKISAVTETTIDVDTSDLTGDFGVETDIGFDVVRPSMYAQYKWEEIVAAATDAAGYVFADANPDTITAQTGTPWGSVVAGDIVTITSAEDAGNNGSYTVASATSTAITLVGTDAVVANASDTTASIAIHRGFARDVGGTIYGYAWRVYGNGGTLADVYQYLQHQMRQSTDIDMSSASAIGNITDQLLTFATPTGTTTNMYIDDLNADDTNNVTLVDATATSRTEKYVATGSIVFNNNLLNDDDTVWKMFFTNCDTFENAGADYGTASAIIVEDASGTPQPIEGSNPASSYSFTFDYDGNVQRGASSAGEDAPVTIVAIGLNTAQFVRVDTTISRAKGQTISLVSALERTYLNQA